MKNNSMNNKQCFNRQSGLTILELLVAMTLGAVVLAAAVSMQVSHRRNFESTDSKMVMQSNARFAFEFISSSLRELGAVGCKTVSSYTSQNSKMNPNHASYLESLYKTSPNYHIALNSVNEPEADFRAGMELEGFDYDSASTWKPANPSNVLVSAPLDGSDMLIVRGAVGPTYIFDTATELTSTTITLDTSRYPLIDLKQNHFAVMSQCAGAEIFKITSTDTAIRTAGTISHAAITGDDENQTGEFKTDFLRESSSTELRRVATSAFYIANNASGDPTLIKSIDGVSSPMVEGVEHMQFLFGVDDDEDNVPDTYKNANQIGADFSKVIAVRVSFIMRSKEEVYKTAQSQTYKLPGETTDFTATDKYSRLIFTSTVSLRNRILGERIKA